MEIEQQYMKIIKVLFATNGTFCLNLTDLFKKCVIDLMSMLKETHLNILTLVCMKETKSVFKMC